MRFRVYRPPFLKIIFEKKIWRREIYLNKKLKAESKYIVNNSNKISLNRYNIALKLERSLINRNSGIEF